MVLEPATVDTSLLMIRVGGRPLGAGEEVEILYGAGPAWARVDRYVEREERIDVPGMLGIARPVAQALAAYLADLGGEIVTGRRLGGNNRGEATVYSGVNLLGVPYCFGDGSGTPCPCSNDNDGSVPGAGCANGVFASGAQLTGSGTASLSADTLVLTTTHLEPNNSGLYFQANNDLSPGNLWGDGLQCAGGQLKRLGVRFSDASGNSDTSGFATSISAKAGNVLAGDTKYYQCWYRNPLNPPCGAGLNDFNASNGYAVTWTP